MKYYINKIVKGPFDEVEGRVVALLKEKGFNIVNETDMQKNFQQNLGVDFRPYKILGACNPSFSHKALLAEDKIGTMMPCNVIIQQHKEGEIEVAAIDPLASMLAVENRNLHELAEIIRDELRSVVERA